MLSKYTEINKFGGYTWQIKIDNLFHIYILGTDNSSFVVEFKEWKWISYKTHFTYISNNNLEMTISEVFEKAFSFFKNHKDFIWTEQQKNQKLNIVLNQLFERDDWVDELDDEIEKIMNNEVKSNEKIEQSDLALDRATACLYSHNLDGAIDSLESFTTKYGNDVNVLLMLTRFKILKKDSLGAIKFFLELNSEIYKNKSLVTQLQSEEFEIVKNEYKKMLNK